MSETYTPPETVPANEEPKEDDFAVLDEWQQQDEAAKRARAIIEAPVTTTVDVSKERSSKSTGVKVVATGILAGATLVGGTLGIGDSVLPGQEIASATSTVQQGEGITQSVYRDIAEIESQKIDPADSTERQDVVSQAIDLHTDSNGIVQPGVNVTVVAEKSPIFGNVTYKAVPNPETETQLPPSPDNEGTIPSPVTR